MNNSGAVYVFTRTGSTWQAPTYLKASNAGANDWFGWALALDGDTLAVGANGVDVYSWGCGEKGQIGCGISWEAGEKGTLGRVSDVAPHTHSPSLP